MVHQPPNRRDDYRADDDEAERRHVVKQRALELKRALLESTLRISPERAAAAYNEAARRARRAKLRSTPFLRICIAILSGALSMLVPIPSTCDLHGQLAAAAPAKGTTVERRALVYAQPAQCARLGIDQLVAIFVERIGSEAARLEGQITRLVPRARSADGACQVELQLLPRPDELQLLRELPAVAAITAVVPMQPSSWLAVLADKAANQDSFEQASGGLAGLSELAAQRGSAFLAYLRNNQNAQQHWETLRQIFAPDEP